MVQASTRVVEYSLVGRHAVRIKTILQCLGFKKLSTQDKGM